jgi:hypothetical protein
MTILLGQVATQMWQQFDHSYFDRNKNRMLDPHNVAEKIAEGYSTPNVTKMETRLKCIIRVTRHLANLSLLLEFQVGESYLLLLK